ncbi:MAG: hypothetical protein QGF15_13650 [Alteromonas macleodii]|jgi:hypothetical protein|nr:hypothetical protein [Alteromonas macleodii]
MATIKGTAIKYGMAANAATGITGQAAVTSVSGGHRAETKRVKDSTGDTMSLVISDQTVEVNATIVCTSSLDTPQIGDTITLANFDSDTDLNDKYYCMSSDVNYSNENELTASVTLLSFNASFAGPV